MPVDVNSFSDEDLAARLHGSGLRGKLKNILDERRARPFLDVADLKRRVRLTPKQLAWLCVGAGSSSVDVTQPRPKRQCVAQNASRAIAHDINVPATRSCDIQTNTTLARVIAAAHPDFDDSSAPRL